MRGIWELVLGVAASVRGSIQHNVFSDVLPLKLGDWGAV